MRTEIYKHPREVIRSAGSENKRIIYMFCGYHVDDRNKQGKKSTGDVQGDFFPLVMWLQLET